MKQLEYNATLATGDISDRRHCQHLLDYATLVTIDVMARDILSSNIAPPHRQFHKNYWKYFLKYRLHITAKCLRTLFHFN
jgi:hypothetical protein